MLRDKFQNLLGVEVEKVVYKYVYNCMKHVPNDLDWNNPNFVNRYISECVRFYENGITSPDQITGFRDIDLSSARRGYVKEVRFRERNYSDIRCGKCKQFTVRFEKKQLRSLDEGTTTVYLCDTCGNSWREN
jgi:DNA-directed RNA polymerase subunit M/transcription elongation factor TFIIS